MVLQLQNQRRRQVPVVVAAAAAVVVHIAVPRQAGRLIRRRLTRPEVIHMPQIVEV